MSFLEPTKVLQFLINFFILIFFLLIASEAVSILKQNFKEFEIPLIASDVLDHYRTYSLLERLLYYPATNLLEQQIPFQLEKQSRLILIEK